jgi:hypothetical protein
MTWTKISDEEFRFVNEEKTAAGSWGYIEEWHFRRSRDTESAPG